MPCEEKVRLLAEYKKCVEHLAAILNPSKANRIGSGEYSKQLKDARDECNLAPAKFQKHVSEHGC
jgi:hypothetical protein